MLKTPVDGFSMQRLAQEKSPCVQGLFDVL